MSSRLRSNIYDKNPNLICTYHVSGVLDVVPGGVTVPVELLQCLRQLLVDGVQLTFNQRELDLQRVLSHL